MKNKQFIGDFLKRIRRPINLDPDREYKLVTIKMNHNGVVLRGLKKGADIKSNMFEVKAGDFILSGIDARNGAFGIVPNELDGAIVTADFWYFHIDEKIINKELFLELTSTTWFDGICKMGSDGTTQRIRLQKDKFFNQEINLPIPNEQNRLLEKIKTIKLKQNNLRIKSVEQKELVVKLSESILDEAIKGQLSISWNGQVQSASDLFKSIQEEKQRLIDAKHIKREKPLIVINEKDKPFCLPKGWIWCRLGDLCTKTGSGSTPTGGKSAYIAKGIKFIRSQNVYSDGLRLTEVAYISEDINKKMKGSQVKPNDLLLNITGGSIGRCSIVDKDFEDGNINQHVAIIRPVLSNLIRFLHIVICSPYFQNEILNVQTGAGREGLPKNKMDNILVPLPSCEEQEFINEKVKNVNQFYLDLEQELLRSQNAIEKLIQSVISEAF
jgi:type I restriction enzyme S subunit